MPARTAAAGGLYNAQTRISNSCFNFVRTRSAAGSGLPGAPAAAAADTSPAWPPIRRPRCNLPSAPGSRRDFASVVRIDMRRDARVRSFRSGGVPHRQARLRSDPAPLEERDSCSSSGLQKPGRQRPALRWPASRIRRGRSRRSPSSFFLCRHRKHLRAPHDALRRWAEMYSGGHTWPHDGRPPRHESETPNHLR